MLPSDQPSIHPALARLERQLAISTLTRIDHPTLALSRVELWLKRDDLLHPQLSGNKWRKLRHSVDHALSLGCDTLVSMGGAYSNHLHALAFTGNCLGLRTVGMVRGDAGQPPTPTLEDARRWGMALRFVGRSDYRLLRQHQHWQALPGIRPNEYWLPEGGAQRLALRGVAQMVAEIDMPYDVICVPCGTGATLAGVIAATSGRALAIGFAAFKHAGFLSANIRGWLDRDYGHWHINHDYHFGGLAKASPELLMFIERFRRQTGVAIEPVYTGKMLYGLFDLVQKGYFAPGQRIIAVHTGGLQGNRGFAGFTGE